MSQPGGWEAKLGWLGSFLAGQDAHQIEILNREAFVAVIWEPMDANRQEVRFSPEDLERPWVPYKLRPDSTSRSVLLSALGYELDAAKLNPASIVEEEDGFMVIGSMSGRYENLFLTYSELDDGGRRRLAGDRFSTADSDTTEVFVAPTPPSSPLRQRLHLP